MENNNEKLVPVVHIKEWVIAIIVSCIPLVGLIMLFVWAFGGSDINENKRNWAKSMLLIELICIILIVLLYAFLVGFALIERH
jgi:uncharacterized membrane protein